MWERENSTNSNSLAAGARRLKEKKTRKNPLNDFRIEFSMKEKPVWWSICILWCRSSLRKLVWTEEDRPAKRKSEERNRIHVANEPLACEKDFSIDDLSDRFEMNRENGLPSNECPNETFVSLRFVNFTFWYSRIALKQIGFMWRDHVPSQSFPSGKFQILRSMKSQRRKF